jgi:rubrerythrin
MTEERSARMFASMDEALDFAIGKEQEAYDFYMHWAPLIESEATGEVFREFAREEEKHKRMLLDVKAGGSFKAAGQAVPDLRLADFFVEVAPSPDMTYQDALLLAIAREKAAHSLYIGLAGSGVGPALAKIFADLADMESRHKLRLESIYDDTFMRED